jgi:uncharacterized membrane protein YheB (UPF0754 family)
MDKKLLHELKEQIENPITRIHDKDVYIIYQRCLTLLNYIHDNQEIKYKDVCKKYIEHLIIEDRIQYSENQVSKVVKPIVETTLMLLVSLGYLTYIHQLTIVTKKGHLFINGAKE